MKKFKQYIQSHEHNQLMAFLLCNYDEYDTFTDLQENITGYDEDAQKESIKGIKTGLESHIDAHYAKSKDDRKAAVKAAKEHFKNTDLRTEDEKKFGESYAKQRAEHNAKPENKKNPLPKSVFEKPLKFSGNIITSTKKHKMAGKDYVIPRGPHEGKGAVVGAVRLTPGTANLGNGKVLRTCPAASKGCEGGSGDRQESGVHKDGLCLAANKGMDTTTNSKADKLARTRALSHPDHQKHAAALVASDLESLHKKAEREDSVAHLRQRDSSDIDLFNHIREKHFGTHPSYMEGKKAKAEMVGYGYSKYAKHDSDGEHINRSDTGPEFDHKGMPIPGNKERKEKTIAHLTGGHHTRAYVITSRIRSAATKGTDADETKDIHTVRYHRYDKDGKYIGHEDFDADTNAKHGDLHHYGKLAERNTHTADGKEKGAITLTDISSGNKKDMENDMVHPLDKDHVTPDPDYPGKKILHVDPPHLRRKIIPIGVAK